MNFRQRFLAEPLTVHITDPELREMTARHFKEDNFTIVDDPDSAVDVTITVNKGRRELLFDTGDYGITRPMPGHGYTPGDVSRRARAFVLDPESHMEDDDE